MIQLNEALDVLSFPSYWNKGVELLNCAIISSKAGKDKETWYVCFSETDELEEWTEEMQQVSHLCKLEVSKSALNID